MYTVECDLDGDRFGPNPRSFAINTPCLYTAYPLYTW